MFPPIKNLSKYIKQRLIPAIFISVAGILFLNYFLAYRLESSLRAELSKRIEQATDGFYTLSFEDLSIHLVSGELRIDGIEFKPDPEVLAIWQQKDSLPETYFSATVESIDFRGINLIWTWNYRELFFTHFDIVAPDVQIYDAWDSDRFQRKPRRNRTKTLYELVSPYMDVITVKKMNMEEASVSFLVENPLTPIKYAIQNTDFYAYDFRLDSLSSINGKLLYCDQLEFVSQQKQRLIQSNEFSLFTDSIRLSTRDSLILVENLTLEPGTNIGNAENYMSGKIDKIEINGVFFHRHNSLNYLDARDLIIESSDLDILTTIEKKDTEEKNEDKNPDSFIHSLSLYEIISPVLHRVHIEEVEIGTARMNYSFLTDGVRDNFLLDDFNFHGYHFVIDSLFEQRNGLWYVNDVYLDANGMEGEMNTLNHRFSADRFLLDTRKGNLLLTNANLKPIRPDYRHDRITASIDTLNLSSLKYRNGLYVGLLELDAPSIDYYQASSTLNGNSSGSPFNQFLHFLAVKDLSVTQGNLIIRNEENSYRIKNLDVFAHHFRMDENSWKKENLPFSLESYGFGFSDFDNQIADNMYNLTVKNIIYTSISEKLQLKDIQIHSLKDTSDISVSYLAASSPSIVLNGIKDPLNNLEDIKINSVVIEEPDVKVINTTPSSKEKIDEQIKKHTVFKPFNQLQVDDLLVNHTSLKIEDRSSGKELAVTYDTLNLKNIDWNYVNSRQLNIEEFIVNAPAVKWKITNYDSLPPKNKTVTLAETFSPYTEAFTIGKFYSDQIEVKAIQPYMDMDFTVDAFRMDSLFWSFNDSARYLQVGEIQINSPFVKIKKENVPVDTLFSVSDTIATSIYDQLAILGDRIVLGGLSVTDAEMEYINQSSDSLIQEQILHATDFGVEHLIVDNTKKTFGFEDISFHTSNFNIPIDNDFYTIHLDDIHLQNGNLQIHNLHMIPRYPKTEFAYLHPKHTDWFDVSAKYIGAKGIDLQAYLTEQILYIKEVQVDDPILLNYKNRKIKKTPQWMPMVYEGLQKAPLKFDIEKVFVNNFGVVYEELAPKGKSPGRLVFTELNGVVTGVTNVPVYPDQYIRLDADGKFYGKGHFDAVWLIPADSLNNRFILEGRMPYFDFTLLNEMVEPLASAEIKSGHLNYLDFTIDASSFGGSIEMLLLYEDLKVNIYKEENGIKKDKKFLNFLVNAVVRDNNPNKPGRYPREVYTVISRDPYHSTFNYWWQFLRPALIESVGVTKQQQDIATGVVGFFNKIKNLFSKKKKDEEISVTDQESEPTSEG